MIGQLSMTCGEYRRDPFPLLSAGEMATLLSPPFTMLELVEAAKRLRVGKAPGPDGIQNEVLVVAMRIVPGIRLNFYNAYLRKRCVPEQ